MGWGTIDGRNETWWEARNGLFFWLLEKIAESAESENVRRLAREHADAGVPWLDLNELSPAEQDAVIALLHTMTEVGRRELPAEHHDITLPKLEELKNLE